MTKDMEKGIDKLSAKINADYCKFIANSLSQIDSDYNRQKDRIRDLIYLWLVLSRSEIITVFQGRKNKWSLNQYSKN